MMKTIDYSIIGKRFGRLTVKELDHIGKNRGTWWKCACDCGNETVVYRGSLTSGDIISCGCYRKEHIHEYGKTHGLTSSPLYSVWSGMIQRCANPNADNFERYGGRGITVCDDWRNHYESFHNWATESGYKKGLSLDRRDNEKGYFPENCQWADRYSQQNNTRRNHYVTWNGITHSIAEWSRILGVNHETLRYRINHGNMVDFERSKNEEV